MSTFKFSFNTEDSKGDTAKEDNSESNRPIIWIDSSEIIPNDEIILNVDEIFPKAKMFTIGDLEIGHIYTEDAVKYIMDMEDNKNLTNDVLNAECQHSDLLTGKYEGGIKIWECTYDLAEYLKEKIPWTNTLVMDLGCGAGILGLIALISGAKVHFQDYNAEVINAVTIPNCLLNIIEEERKTILDKCKFFSGDWKSLSGLIMSIDENKYDYILSSETIYNVENHEKLFQFIKNHLKKDGTAYLAAKTYYFGVGGGIRQFESLVNKSDEMKCEICWKNESGVMREIIKITFK